MTTALYLISSGEVLKVSTVNQPFDDADTDYFAVLTDPSTPDGTAAVDPDGDLRVLGYAKIAVPASNTVRDATAPEIATFEPAWAAYEKALDGDRARAIAELDPVFRKVIAGLLELLVTRFNQTNAKINTLGAQFEQFKTEGGNAASLAALRTTLNNFADINFNLPDSITKQQAIAALKNLILDDD